jgi:hypothetical protein
MIKLINDINLVRINRPRVINSGKMFSLMPNIFDPIRKDLWSIEFPVQMNIPETFQVKAARPKTTNARKEIPYKHLTTYYKGKTNTETMTIAFRDAIGPGVYAKLLAWQREHTDFATGKGGYAQTYKKELVLNMEDPTGAVIQKFILHGVFIVDIDGGELDMTSDDIAEVTMTISYDSYTQVF